MSKLYSQGLTILELMIAMFLGLLLMSSVFTIFKFSHDITSETLRINEQLENGDFALQILTQDLKHSYFFLDASVSNNTLWENIPSIEKSKDCLDKNGFGSFPSDQGFHPLWASTVSGDATNFIMPCLINNDVNIDLVPRSDYISIKRIRGFRQRNNYDISRYYLDIDMSKVNVSLGINTSKDSVHWEYIHHVYYLDKSEGVSRLRRLSLQTNKMHLDGVIAEGIEQMKFMFLLDAKKIKNRDFNVHSIVNSTDISSDDWSSGRVIGIEIFLLVRASDKSPNYINKAHYQLGDQFFPPKNETPYNDAYKRKVFSRILMFINQARSS